MNMKVKKCLLVVVMVFGMIVSFGGNKVEASEKVDINSATIEELQKLDGVGAPLAQKIIDARPYKTVDELQAKVAGIGAAKMKAIVDQGLAVAESFPEKIDINKASLYDLQFLAGVGAPLAQKIIDARPYKTVDELQVKVVGIGAAKMKAIKDQGLAMVNEEKMIKEWFPDSNLASGVAKSMNKNVEDIVTRDELAEVTQLKAEQVSRLEGLQNLVNLTELNLSLNSTISNLDELGSLTELTNLGLWNGEIQDVSALAKLKKLKKLTMERCGLKNLDGLKEAESIEVINVASNELTNLNGLINCKNLTQITADNNKISNLNGLNGLKKITFLRIYTNKLTNLNGLENCENLLELHAGSNGLTNVDALINLEKIDTLWISGNKIENLAGLKNMKEIGHLEICVNKLNNLDELKNIKMKQSSINVSRNELVSLDGLSGNAHSFTEINASNNKLITLDSLVDSPHLEKLNVSNNKLINIDGIRELKKIRSLNLSHNELESVDNAPDFDESLNPSIDYYFNFSYNHVYSIENVLHKICFNTWLGNQKIIMPEQTIVSGQDLLVENIVKSGIPFSAKPLGISHGGICKGQDITWNNLTGQGEVSYRFGTIDSGDLANYGFSGEVIIPYKVIE